MNEPINYGFDFAVLRVKDEWTHSITWNIYEVFGQDTKTGNWCYQNWSDGARMATPVDNIEDATVWATLTVKWDGCSHLNLLDEEGYFHVCGYDAWKSFDAVVTDLFSRSKALMNEMKTHTDGSWPGDTP